MIAIKNKRIAPIPQETDATCWLAAYQMMFNWKGKPTDTIPTLMKSAVSSVSTCYEKGLDKTEWEKTGKAFGLTTVAGTGSFSASALMGYLAKSPVLIHGQFKLGMHSIVVIGCTVAESSDDLEMVVYINPYWSGTKQVFERSSVFKSYLLPAIAANNGTAGVIQYW